MNIMTLWLNDQNDIQVIFMWKCDKIVDNKFLNSSFLALLQETSQLLHVFNSQDLSYT